MARLRALVWDLVEVIGLGVLVVAVFRLFGEGWGLIAVGAVLVVVANIRGR